MFQLRCHLAWIVLLSTTYPALAETFTSYPTQTKTKIIYARAAGEVTHINLRTGQVFLWDELAVAIKPSQNVRPEFGRANTEFAGSVSKLLVAAGDQVEKGAPLIECRLLENVYTSCLVPARLQVQEDQPIRAFYQGEAFDGKVISTQTEGGQTYVNLLIYNSHEERYWHLTHGLQLTVQF